MRFTIERLRTILLVAGALLVVALGVFLAFGRWKNALFRNRDIPKRLGIDISQESNGVTYTQSRAGHTLFKIHASKVTQLKNDHALLHDVDIELYGPDGSRTDRIAGKEFEYDQQAQVAMAAGPVEITMTRPAPAQSAATKPAKPRAQAAPDQIHVRTSGLSFDRKTGIATTDQRVDFSVTQGSGTSIGATYDSEQGHLVLDRQVELNLNRNGEAVKVHANHAEFERGDMICNLRGAEAQYRNGEATAGKATIVFRDDGSAVRLDAGDQFTMSTATGGRLTAPKGWLVFNERNQPQQGHLEGGVAMDSLTHTDQSDRRAHGTSPTAELAFTEDGELRHAHLERGVEMTSDEQSVGELQPFQTVRTWLSPVADVDFRPSADNSRVEPEQIHGVGGVAITATTQTGTGPALPSKMAADDVTANLGPGGALSELKGLGHARLEETTSKGTRQTSSGDRLEAHFTAATAPSASARAARPTGGDRRPPAAGAAQIESADLDGHVIITQQPAAKPGETAPATMRATAGHADYESSGEWMHLVQVPMVTDGSMQLTADKIDVSQATGDAFGHGNVKATWLTQNEAMEDRPAEPMRSKAMSGFGGQGPSHVIADEAEMNQATGVATFRGNARLWQESNSVAAPLIAINRLKETLVATSRDPRSPVRVVLVSARGSGFNAPGKNPSNKDESKEGQPSVIRVSGGSLRYSDAEHKAVVSAMDRGRVEAETGTANTVADQVELTLLPPGNHRGKTGGAAQVDTMTARGHVVVTSQDRRGTGAKLVYTGENEDYVLTGTGDSPPKLTDPVKGTVTGEALIFHSRDDSVSIEGGGNETVTQTRTPKGRD